MGTQGTQSLIATTKTRSVCTRCLIGFGFFLTTAIALSMASGNVFASSESAWRAFRNDVWTACIAAARHAKFQVQAIAVDPFGSYHYGLARLIGHERGGDESVPQQVLCTYDKKQHTAEVGTLMPAQAPTQVDGPKPDRSGS